MHYLLVIIAVYVVLLLLLLWREPHMIYYPLREIEATPDRAGLPYEDVTLTAADGVRINGWFVPAQSRTASLTVLFFHGNAGNISHRLEKLALLHERGVATFIIDYRGYGRSQGAPNEPGTYADARAAYEYLIRQRGLEPKQIALYGESLGSAVAVQLATERAVAGVVLEEAFTSVGAVGQRMFPFLPVRHLTRNKYDSRSKIARINAPLLLFHSRTDEEFPFYHAEQLLAAAREPKQLIELRGDHNSAFAISLVTYTNSLESFFQRIGKMATPSDSR